MSVDSVSYRCLWPSGTSDPRTLVFFGWLAWVSSAGVAVAIHENVLGFQRLRSKSSKASANY